LFVDVVALNIDWAIDCTIIIKIGSGIKTVTGSGVAVSPNKAVAALHGKCKVKQKVTVIDRHGHRMDGTVSFMRYAADKVDIAVVTLSGSAQFRAFMPYLSAPVSLGQELKIIGLKPDAHDNSMPFILSGIVSCIEPTTTLFHFVSYYRQVGMSGCEIVSVLRGTEFFVVGVHAVRHGHTVPLSEERPKKKAKRAGKVTALEKSHEKLAKDQLTINSNLHGHHAYNLICEITRVDGLIAFLSE
jgi:hypothetical protein